MRAAGLEVLGCCERLSQCPGLMEHSPLLQDFTREEVDVLGAMMLHVRARPGQMLIVEGAADDWLMLLLKGTVDVGKRLEHEGEREERGDNTRLAVLRTGAVLGEMSMFDGEPRYASCWALGEVEAAVMDRADVARLGPGHEHAGEREARGRMRELGIARLGRNRKRHRRDDFAVLKRRGEQTLEEIVGPDRALVGLDGCAERKHRRRIIRGRIVVGERTADGAAMAHRRITDRRGEVGERGDRA